MVTSYTRIQFGCLIHSLLRAGPPHYAYQEALTEVSRAYGSNEIILTGHLPHLCAALAAAHSCTNASKRERQYYARGLAAICAATGAPVPSVANNGWLRLLAGGAP